MACIIYCCCRCRKCKKNNGGQESYNGSIVGFSNTDQQSLIEPKGILKHRENSYSTSGAELPRFGQGSTCGYQEMQETRSLSQLSGKRSLDSNHTAISQATLHSFDAGQYPDLLDIPNRDQQASPTTNIPEPISPQVKRLILIKILLKCKHKAFSTALIAVKLTCFLTRVLMG